MGLGPRSQCFTGDGMTAAMLSVVVPRIVKESQISWTAWATCASHCSRGSLASQASNAQGLSIVLLASNACDTEVASCASWVTG